MDHKKADLNGKTHQQLVEIVLDLQKKLKENSVTYGGKLPIGPEKD